MGKKLVCGVGTTDVKTVTKGKTDKSYTAWTSMLERCYSKKFHQRQPTYAGCSVSPEWLVYSNFKEWFDLNYRPGYQLDKDLLKVGNKIYGPDNCVMIPNHINSLLLDHRAARGQYPIGVSIHNPTAKYQVHINRYGKLFHVGLYKTPSEAFATWCSAKKAYLMEVCAKYEGLVDPRALIAIRKHAEGLEDLFTPGVL